MSAAPAMERVNVLTLQSIELRNFMGITHFSTEFNGRDMDIFGDNGTGKTSILNGLCWLLFGKNAEGKEQFEVKPLDKNNKPLHNLNYEVSATLWLDGKTIKLKRVLHEVWGKERQTKGTFKNETDYFIDEIPVTATQYSAYINGICPESRFWMLINEKYFNVNLHWQKRREVLLEICGDVTDFDVIESSETLKDLPAILDGRSLDDLRKLIGVKSKELKSRLGLVPELINEATRALTDDSEIIDVDAIEARISELRVQGQALTSGGRAAELAKEITECDAKLIARRNELAQLRNETFEGNLHIVREKQLALSDLEALRNQHERELKALVFDLDAMHDRLIGLRNEDDEVSASQFVWSGAENCSSCGQPLPAGQVAETKTAQEQSFNLRKSERLEQLLEEGKKLAESVEEQKSHIRTKEETISDLNDNQIPLASHELAQAKELAEANVVPSIDPESDPASVEIVARKAELAKERESVIADNKAAVDDLTTKIEAAKARLKDANETNAAVIANERTRLRIEELTKEEELLSKESEKLEHELWLTEEFIRVKVKLLESRINSNFNYVGFKLFKEQINGGLAECCVCTVDGVPYDGALNPGKQVNAGLDIVRTLQRHYGFWPPVIIDGAESTTSYLPMDCQVIRLYVSKADKTLRFA